MSLHSQALDKLLEEVKIAISATNFYRFIQFLYCIDVDVHQHICLICYFC